MRERFEKEAKLLNLLSQKHQQFPKLYDYLRKEKNPILSRNLLMERILGTSFQTSS
jgi:predicted Ser/Thr protein kinase